MNKEFKIRLVQTCGACPEQYDAFHSETGEEIGYLRLRHGCFTAEYKGMNVYGAETRGDGCFDSNERDYFLHKACEAIIEAHLEHDKDLAARSYYF